MKTSNQLVSYQTNVVLTILGYLLSASILVILAMLVYQNLIVRQNFINI